MSIADEAHAEAEKRWPDETDPIFWNRSRERERFTQGAEWLASRKPEAAPSDTDRLDRATIMRLRQASGQEFERLLWDDSALSQPVQVEVTDDMAAKVMETVDAHRPSVDQTAVPDGWCDCGFNAKGDWDALQKHRVDALRAALSAALGGGER